MLELPRAVLHALASDRMPSHCSWMGFLLRPLQTCKFRPDGMEDSPPGCGYELGDARSGGAQNRSKVRTILHAQAYLNHFCPR